MACSKQQTDLSASILAGSDEMFDFFCQPCSPDKHAEAVGYCQECSEYLCITCTDCHGKLSATKHHKVLDKSTMPKIKPPPRIQNTDVLTEKCLKHPDKVLEYFCPTRNQIICSICAVDHSSCLSKTYVPNISGDMANSQECRSLTADLDRILLEITNRQEKINDANSNNDKNRSMTLADVAEFRKQINELLDRIEEETKRKVDKLHQQNTDLIRLESAKYQSLLTHVSSMAAKIDKMAKDGRNNQLFVQVKLSAQRIVEVDKQLREHGEFKATQYAFGKDEKHHQMMSTLSAIWSLSVRQDDTPSKARYVREINVKSNDETGECYIDGIAVVDKGRMVVTDCNNKAVKLVDTKDNKILSRLPVSSGPLDIIGVQADQVAVALGHEQKIAMISVTDVLSTNRIIRTPGAAIIGMCYNGSYFITTCLQPNCIKIIDMSGNTLNTFSTDDKGGQLFTMPWCITLSRNKEVVYITDTGANTMTSMTLSGHVISVYRHQSLRYPYGVAIGKDGSVYVCSRDTNTVHQLTPTGDLKRIILGLGQGLAVGSGTIAYGDEDDSLYICNLSTVPAQRNYIRLYKLE